MKHNITTIRPKVIFQEIEKRFPNKNINFTVNIPTSQIGGLTLLESSILVSFIKLMNPTLLFEFGTYMGATTILLAQNSANNSKVISLDIDPNETQISEIDESTILQNDIENDNFLRRNFINDGAKYILNSDIQTKNKIELILQNSLLLDPVSRDYKNKFDFIFIDGGHEYDIVKKDTQNALTMAKDDAIILWHDYNSNIHGDISTFLNEFSVDYKVFHVANTMLAFLLLGDAQNLLEKI